MIEARSIKDKVLNQTSEKLKNENSELNKKLETLLNFNNLNDSSKDTEKDTLNEYNR